MVNDASLEVILINSWLMVDLWLMFGSDSDSWATNLLAIIVVYVSTLVDIDCSLRIGH